MEWPARLPPVGGGGVSERLKLGLQTYKVAYIANPNV